jgi:hypothetical protein
MKTRSVLGILGLAPVLILSAAAVPQRLPAQQPGSGPAPAGKAGEAPLAPGFSESKSRQRAEAQGRAQLRLLELQKRQFEEQSKEQIRELEDEEREQLEQLKAEANRQAEQYRRQVKRQIEQIKLRYKWQQETLDAQMKLVEAQAGVQSEPSRPARRTGRTTGQPPSVQGRDVPRQPVVRPSVEGKLEQLLDRLERIEQRLDKLEKR